MPDDALRQGFDIDCDVGQFRHGSIIAGLEPFRTIRIYHRDSEKTQDGCGEQAFPAITLPGQSRARECRSSAPAPARTTEPGRHCASPSDPSCNRAPPTARRSAPRQIDAAIHQRAVRHPYHHREFAMALGPRGNRARQVLQRLPRSLGRRGRSPPSLAACLRPHMAASASTSAACAACCKIS